MRARPALGALALAFPFLVGAAWPGPEPEGPEVFRFASEEIVESSGLVWSDGLVLTTNDSGDVGRVFAVDPGTGNTVGTTTWLPDGDEAEAPVDVEALAPAGPGAVWVGDVGDNLRARDTVAVYRVPVGRGDRTATPTAVRLRHPGGPRDAETLLAHPRTGRLYVVSKGVLGGVLAAAPARLRPGRVHNLREVGPVLALATDGAFWPDGRHLVLRGYSRAVVYAWPSLRLVGEVDLPRQEQGEGLAVTPDGRLLLSSEGLRQPVLEVALPAGMRRAMRAGAAAGGASAEPSGTASPGRAGAATPSPGTPERSSEARAEPDTGSVDGDGGPSGPSDGLVGQVGLVGLVGLAAVVVAVVVGVAWWFGRRAPTLRRREERTRGDEAP